MPYSFLINYQAILCKLFLLLSTNANMYNIASYPCTIKNYNAGESSASV